MPNLNATKQTGVHLVTTNGDTTTAATFVTRSDTAYVVQARIIAIKVDNLLGDADTWGSVVSYGHVSTFINDGGTLVEAAPFGTRLWTHEEGDVGGYSIDITPSGTNILVRVAGAAAQKVHWLVDADIREVGINSLLPN